MNYFQIDTKIKNTQTITCNKAENYCILLLNYSGVIDVEIKHTGAHVYIYGIYIGQQDTQFRLNTIQHHKVGKSISDLLIKGIFFDESKLFYEGLIKIDKNAQQSNAYQKNQNILMSSSVFVDSRPYLEIEANDVRCTHGSTTGQLPKESIQFLNLRGLNNETAEKILLNGFIEDVFNKIEENGFQNEARVSKIKCLESLSSIFNDKTTRSTKTKN